MCVNSNFFEFKKINKIGKMIFEFRERKWMNTKL